MLDPEMDGDWLKKLDTGPMMIVQMFYYNNF